MAFTKKIKAGTVPQSISSFVGEQGTIFYDFYTGTMRISDGTTPGGQPVNLIGSFNDIAVGNLVINGTTITPAEPDANISVAATGTGTVHITSPFAVHRSNLAADPIFEITPDGAIQVFVEPSGNVGAFKVNGDPSHVNVPTDRTGTLAHMTGAPAIPGRFLFDGNNEYVAFSGRRFNGTTTAPTQVLANQQIARFAGTGYTDSGWPAASSSRIIMIANETLTSSAQGTRMEFWVTPNGQTSPVKVADFTGNTFTANNIVTTGEVNIKSSSQNPNNTSVLNIIGSSSGTAIVPANPGGMLQITGHDDTACRFVSDAFGDSATTFNAIVGRRARGSVTSPANVQTGDVLLRVVGAGYRTTGFGVAPQSGIEVIAAENYTDSANGNTMKLHITPNGSTTWVDAVTISQTGVEILPGTRFTGKIVLPAGTTSIPPIQFTPGDLVTNPLAGAFGYDGIAFYATPQAGERGLIASDQVYVLNAARNLTAGTTALQSLFGVGITLSANTRYYYQMRFKISKNGSAANAPTINFALGGTATYFSHNYSVCSGVGAVDAAMVTSSTMWDTKTTNFGVGVPVTTAMPINASYAVVTLTGIIDTNLAGTMIPQIAFSDAPNTSCSVQPMSKICIHSFGRPGSNTVIGAWV